MIKELGKYAIILIIGMTISSCSLLQGETIVIDPSCSRYRQLRFEPPSIVGMTLTDKRKVDAHNRIYGCDCISKEWCKSKFKEGR